MKKLFTLAFCALLGGALWASSPSNLPANPFQDNLSCLDVEFFSMNQLEILVEERSATYSQLALENNALLNYVTSDHEDISVSLLGAGGKMDEAWKFVLIVIGILVVLACGCLLMSALNGIGPN